MWTGFSVNVFSIPRDKECLSFDSSLLLDLEPKFVRASWPWELSVAYEKGYTTPDIHPMIFLLYLFSWMTWSLPDSTCWFKYASRPLNQRSHKSNFTQTYVCVLLHLHEIVEGLYFHYSLSVCVCVCVWVCLSVNKIPAERMRRFGCSFC